jgi:monoamine oxidase
MPHRSSRFWQVIMPSSIQGSILWRSLLARRTGRVVFAGEHTSERWQGYMNGAVESGQRAARELPTVT